MSVEVEVGGVYEPAADLTPTGAIIAFGGSTAPTGWFLCDGSAKNRTTESSLFDIIGTTFGNGDGSTTFDLPDLRGIFPRGAGVNGTMTKADTSAFDGGSLGDETDDKMQGHADTYFSAVSGDSTNNSALGITVPQTGISGFMAGGNPSARMRFTNTKGSLLTDNTNGDPRTGDETAPASLSVNYIIKN